MRVSIITVVFNNKKFIQDAIDSVKSQRYNNLEYIIIDGGSTDGTIEIIKNNMNIIDVLISESDKGIYDAMNKGIVNATGDIIGILNSDDEFFSANVICDVIEVFEKYNDIDLVIGNVQYVNPINKKIKREYLSSNFQRWMMRFGFMPAHTATFVKKDCYKKVGVYSLNYKIASDFDWFCRVFYSQSLRVKFINKFFVKMKLGGVSSSGFESAFKITHEIKVILRSNLIYSNLLFINLRLPVKFINNFIRKIFQFF
jgi:glycosyltransferase involved in cell wall biosynthesis